MPAGLPQTLTDSSGGTTSATRTVVDVPASYTEATLAAQLATLVTAVNALIKRARRLPR